MPDLGSEKLPGPDENGRFSFKELADPKAQEAMGKSTLFAPRAAETGASTEVIVPVDNPARLEAAGGVALSTEVTIVESPDGHGPTEFNPGMPSAMPENTHWQQPPATTEAAPRTGLVGTIGNVGNLPPSGKN